MAVITFYGKPNCINNRKQRDILVQAGHTVVVRDILAQPWTQESLLSFLQSRPFSRLADSIYAAARHHQKGEQ